MIELIILLQEDLIYLHSRESIQESSNTIGRKQKRKENETSITKSSLRVPQLIRSSSDQTEDKYFYCHPTTYLRISSG